MFDKSLIQEIINAWNSDQNNPRRDRLKQPIPELSIIRKLIEIAFIASLEKEEDRAITFSLSLFNEDMSKSLRGAMGFKKPFPLNVETVTKLAPAIDPEMSSFVVSKSDTTDELLLCGVVSFSQPENRFNKVPGQIGNLSCTRPDVFTLTTIHPGSLLITRGNSQIGRFAKGEFVAATPSPFAPTAMGKYIFSFVEQHELYKKYGESYWHIYRDSLDFILSEAAARSNGASIVLVNENHFPAIKKGFIHGYRFFKKYGIKELFSEYMNYPTIDIPRDIKMRKMMSERLQLIAQYTSIDGALILSDLLDVVSFGTKLSAGTWSGEVLVGPDGFNRGGQDFRYDHFGTRHKSAIDFVGEHENAIVFVLSQDGPIRGFVKINHKTILCWPDCTVSMFI
ncbi:putative sensor domain DACNV-containing protein [Desulfogranum marinum]|uniref:putative sensor domain DACNV-containing protein n=1 Tax=Desulfogranum marinum TaxID=453220 RepID=UPI0029C68E90|nr:hypothetical protein [Desulfogranum marinum]